MLQVAVVDLHAAVAHLDRETGRCRRVEGVHAVVGVLAEVHREHDAALDAAVVRAADVVLRVHLEHEVVQALGHRHRRERDRVMARVRVQEADLQRELRVQRELHRVAEAHAEELGVEALRRRGVHRADHRVAEALVAGHEARRDAGRAERLLRDRRAAGDLDGNAARIGELEQAAHPARRRGLGLALRRPRSPRRPAARRAPRARRRSPPRSRGRRGRRRDPGAARCAARARPCAARASRPSRARRARGRARRRRSAPTSGGRSLRGRDRRAVERRSSRFSFWLGV